MKRMIGIVVFSTLMLLLSGQSSPGIDSLLTAIEENKRINCRGGCGTPCRQIEFTLRLKLCEQYFDDGYESEGLKLASESVYISIGRPQERNKGWHTFLKLFERRYSQNEISELLSRVEVQIEIEEIYTWFEDDFFKFKDNVSLYCENDNWDGIIKVYLRLDDILLLVPPMLCTLDDCTLLLESLGGNQEAKLLFEKRILNSVWEKSDLYHDLVSQVR